MTTKGKIPTLVKFELARVLSRMCLAAQPDRGMFFSEFLQYLAPRSQATRYASGYWRDVGARGSDDLLTIARRRTFL
jgi:hypothetical protein